MDTSELIIADLCAGTGMLGEGVRLALASIGIRSRAGLYAEWEACAAASLVARMESQAIHPAPVWSGDLREFDAEPWRDSVDILAAGYPCQPFSYAGRRGGKRDTRHLWPVIRRIVAKMQPGLVFFENVDGHVSLGAGKVIRDLQRLGFTVTAGVFSAEEVGAPHLRKRLFILGLANTESTSIQHASTVASDSSYRGATAEEVRKLGHAEEYDWGCGYPHATREGSRTQDGREQLADGQLSRLQGKPAARQTQSSNGQIGRGGRASLRGIFPPARTDYRRWAELVANGLDPSDMPAIESGVSVVADGMVPPSDLLRLGGNGVVPTCAAWAFLQLFCCLLPTVVQPDC